MVETFLRDLRAGSITAVFVTGSMPAIRATDNICVDESLEGGSITNYKMDSESAAISELQVLFVALLKEQVVWE